MCVWCVLQPMLHSSAAGNDVKIKTLFFTELHSLQKCILHSLRMCVLYARGGGEQEGFLVF